MCTSHHTASSTCRACVVVYITSHQHTYLYSTANLEAHPRIVHHTHTRIRRPMVRLPNQRPAYQKSDYQGQTTKSQTTKGEATNGKATKGERRSTVRPKVRLPKVRLPLSQGSTPWDRAASCRSHGQGSTPWHRAASRRSHGCSTWLPTYTGQHTITKEQNNL